MRIDRLALATDLRVLLAAASDTKRVRGALAAVGVALDDFPAAKRRVLFVVAGNEGDRVGDSGLDAVVGLAEFVHPFLLV